MDRELLLLCNQVVTRYAYLGYDDHNDFTWATNSTSFLARIEYQNKLIRTGVGQELLSTCQIYCDGSTVINERDKITAIGFTKIDPEILKIENQPDDKGNIYYKCIYTK